MRFSLVILYLLTIGLAATFPANLAPAVTPVESVKALKQNLEKLGFPASAISEKPLKRQGVELTLIRVLSHPRVYDISVFSSQKYYLAISFDRGKHFGEPLVFKESKNLLDKISRIEKREQAKLPVKLSTPEALADTDSTQKSTARNLGQKQGLSEQAQRQKKIKDEERLRSTAELTAALNQKARDANRDLATAAGMATGGAEVSGALAAGNNSCRSPAQSNHGGLPQAGIQLAETMLGLSLGLNETSSSDYLKIYGSSKTVEQLRLIQAYSGGLAADKQALLRSLLTDLVLERDQPLLLSYPSMGEEFARFKTWAQSEKLATSDLESRLLIWVDQLQINPELYAKTAQFYPLDQQFDFMVRLDEPAILLDPEHESPSSAAKAFFRAASLLIKSEAMNLNPLREQLKQAFALTTYTALDQLWRALRAYLDENPNPQEEKTAKWKSPELGNTLNQAIESVRQQKGLVTLSPQRFFAAPYLLTKTPAMPEPLYYVAHADLLPPPIYLTTNLMQHQEGSAQPIWLNLEPLQMEGWNRLMQGADVALTSMNAIREFPKRFLSIAAPGELPEWQFNAKAESGLSPENLSLLRSGWGYRQNSDTFNLRFFSKSVRGRFRLWDLTVLKNGQITALKQRLLE